MANSSSGSSPLPCSDGDERGEAAAFPSLSLASALSSRRRAVSPPIFCFPGNVAAVLGGGVAGGNSPLTPLFSPPRSNGNAMGGDGDLSSFIGGVQQR
nr:hypothetical protein Itr_chr04CG18400 [Ipomoea trifida]